LIILTDNIRDGVPLNPEDAKSEARAKKIKEFNDGVKGGMAGPEPGGTIDDVRKRGRSSLKRRGKKLIMAGFVAGLANIANAVDASEKAVQLKEVLTNGKGMRRAMEAAERGNRGELRACLFGHSLGITSTYDELRGISNIVAESFYEEGEPALRKLEEQLDEFDRFTEDFEIDEEEEEINGADSNRSGPGPGSATR
jgi:hypothetical protein